MQLVKDLDQLALEIVVEGDIWATDDVLFDHLLDVHALVALYIFDLVRDFVQELEYCEGHVNFLPA